LKFLPVPEEEEEGTKFLSKRQMPLFQLHNFAFLKIRIYRN
jgi:hypothetical protein